MKNIVLYQRYIISYTKRSLIRKINIFIGHKGIAIRYMPTSWVNFNRYYETTETFTR